MRDKKIIEKIFSLICLLPEVMCVVVIVIIVSKSKTMENSYTTTISRTLKANTIAKTTGCSIIRTQGYLQKPGDVCRYYVKIDSDSYNNKILQENSNNESMETKIADNYTVDIYVNKDISLKFNYYKWSEGNIPEDESEIPFYKGDMPLITENSISNDVDKDEYFYMIEVEWNSLYSENNIANLMDNEAIDILVEATPVMQ